MDNYWSSKLFRDILNFKLSIVHCQLSIVVFCFLFFTTFGQASPADSLLHKLSTDKQDTIRVNDMAALAANCADAGKTDSVMKLAQQMLTLSDQLHYAKGQMAAYNYIGYTYQLTSNFDKAIESYNNAIKVAVSIGDKAHIIKFNGKIGNVYSDMGNFAKALEYYQAELKTAQDLGDKKIVALVTGDIGNAYEFEGDYVKALDYNFKALQMDEDNADKRSIATVNGNIGNIYVDEKNYKLALDYYFKALKVDSELNDKNSIAINIGNVGNIYGIQGDHDKALDYALKALGIDVIFLV